MLCPASGAIFWDGGSPLAFLRFFFVDTYTCSRTYWARLPCWSPHYGLGQHQSSCQHTHALGIKTLLQIGITYNDCTRWDIFWEKCFIQLWSVTTQRCFSDTRRKSCGHGNAFLIMPWFNTAALDGEHWRNLPRHLIRAAVSAVLLPDRPIFHSNCRMHRGFLASSWEAHICNQCA